MEFGLPPALTKKRRAANDAAWEDSLAKLLEFHRQHGHFCVPSDAEHRALFYWTAHHRSHLNTGRLAPQRRERLLAAGFPGDPRFIQKQKEDRIWEQHLAELMAFHREHGHFKLPRTDPNYKLLVEWARHMRRKKAAGKLKPERQQRLDEIHFPWFTSTARGWNKPSPLKKSALQKPANTRWERLFAELRTFHEVHGHFQIPEGIYRRRGSFVLNGWIMEQRLRKLHGQLTLEQEQRLTALGFPWEIK